MIWPARFPNADTTGQYWIRSGIAGFANDAADHFFLPERYIDPFNSVTTLSFDPLDLFIGKSIDPVGNTTRVAGIDNVNSAGFVAGFDYRVLAPTEMADANNNRSKLIFDTLGLPVVSAVMGKGNEGDDLAGIDHALANPDHAQVESFFTSQIFDESTARDWLANATQRYVYHFGEKPETLSAAAPSCIGANTRPQPAPS